MILEDTRAYHAKKQGDKRVLGVEG